MKRLIRNKVEYLQQYDVIKVAKNLQTVYF